MVMNEVKDILHDLEIISRYPGNMNASFICRKAAECIKALAEYLENAEKTICACEEAFYDRCHDDYAEQAIDEWNEWLKKKGGISDDGHTKPTDENS